MYATVKHNSGGYHGHQIKDWLGGLTIAKLFDLDVLKSKYAYLDHFALGATYPPYRPWTSKQALWIKKKMTGPFWDGITSLEEAKATLEPMMTLSDSKGIYVMEKALRIHPFQTISWHESGMIQKNIFDEVLTETSRDYEVMHGAAPKRDFVFVAVHISRGVDYDPNRFPDHFEQSYNVRYMFDLDYFSAIMDQIRENLTGKSIQFHIYTEALHSREILDRFSPEKDCEVHVGSNRKEGNDNLIHHIFKQFVHSDILVACNSSFSAMCAYFRKGKTTIYHPHRHLDLLPAPNFLATDIDGKFSTKDLKLSFQ